ncbi:MAG: hypothetical protein ACRD5H_09170 [Nitrososphaerales archaeon]
MAWLKTIVTVNQEPHHEAQNVIIDVANPLIHKASDMEIMNHVDVFLRLHDAWPVISVANTIFPEALYRRHGAPKFYDVYLKMVYPRVKRKQGDWGRYFERMIRYPSSTGEPLNPLADLVAKLKQHVGAERTFRNAYELSILHPHLDIGIYDPSRDAGPVMNRQCLSFLSFKLDANNRLLLTAMYRNHYYVARLLGNLIGLGRLMAFVGKEAKIEVGSLTVVSTHAQIDTDKWKRAEISKLLKACEAVLS